LFSAGALHSTESFNNIASSQAGDDDASSIRSHPVLRHKDSSGGMGMLQYKAGDEAKIVQSLILGKIIIAAPLLLVKIKIL